MSLVGPGRIVVDGRVAYAESRCQANPAGAPCISAHVDDGLSDSINWVAFWSFVALVVAAVFVTAIAARRRRQGGYDLPEKPLSRRQAVLRLVAVWSSLACGLVLGIGGIASWEYAHGFSHFDAIPWQVIQNMRISGHTYVSGGVPLYKGTTVYGVTVTGTSGNQLCDVSLAKSASVAVTVTCPSVLP